MFVAIGVVRAAEDGATDAAVSNAVAETKPVEPVDITVSPELDAVLKKKFPENAADLRAIEQQTRKVLERVLPATVGLQIGSSAGSGVVVNPEGLILTAGHVAGKPGRNVLVIFADGRRVRGKTLGVNHAADSGMIQIADEGDWPWAKIASKDGVKDGEWVIATGHPGGYRVDRSPPVRLGRVLFSNANVICTDCTLVGGDSGGPLFNMSGEVVAIHSRIGRDITSNFHVPIGEYRSAWDRLVGGEIWGGDGPEEMQTKQRPYLGVHLDGRDSRPRIAQVDLGSPAQRAGVEPGDIITSFDGQAIATRDEFVRRFAAAKPSQSVQFEVDRNGERIEVEARLLGITRELPGGMPETPEGNQPDKGESDDAEPADPNASPPEPNGGESDDAPEKEGPKNATPESSPGEDAAPKAAPSEGGSDPPNAETDDTPSKHESDPLYDVLGVEIDPSALRCIVARVKPDTHASTLGVQPGDVIVRFANEAVGSVDSLRAAVKKADGVQSAIVVRRAGREITLSPNTNGSE